MLWVKLGYLFEFAADFYPGEIHDLDSFAPPEILIDSIINNKSHVLRENLERKLTDFPDGT